MNRANLNALAGTYTQGPSVSEEIKLHGMHLSII